MGLKNKFNRAAFIINRLEPRQLRGLKIICKEIAAAQADLRHAAKPLMHRCISGCEGLCCRNIQADEIISLGDCMLILATGDIAPDEIARHLRHEPLLFRSDCVFLKNGKGPCIFPLNARPEVCLTSFCDDASMIKGEVARLKWRFFKLNCFIMRHRPLTLLRSIWHSRQNHLTRGPLPCADKKRCQYPI
jgi:hypothetical protein